MNDQLIDRLNELGFQAIPGIGSHPPQPVYEGSVVLSSGVELKLHVRFPEREYNFPIIRLIEWEHSKPIRSLFSAAHIDTNGVVCHSDESVTYWDSSNPANSLSYVFNSLLKILESKVQGEGQAELFARDFLGYWRAENKLYLGVHNYPANKPLNFVQNDPTSKITNCNSAWLLQEKQNYPGVESPTPSSLKFFALDLPGSPNDFVPDNWPPKKTSELFQYLSSCEGDTPDFICNTIYRIDKRAGQDAKRFLNKSFKKNGGLIGLLMRWSKSDESLFAVTFKIDKNIAQAISAGRIDASISLLKRDHSKISRYGVEVASPGYIHKKRMLHNDVNGLEGKSVILIGAGAIGSHLAPMLCALGAGQKRGTLTICDKDIHKMGNVARSALGFDSVGMNKALALKEQLQRQYPYARTKVVDNTFTKISSSLLSSSHLIIDVTGSINVGIGLSKLNHGLSDPTTIIHTWIHGQGLAVVNFKSEGGRPCYRCLWHYKNDELVFKNQISRWPEDDEVRSAGCHESFMPYSITASSAAATLCISSIESWLSNGNQESLTYNVLRPERCFKIINGTPRASRNCPICG